MGSTNIIMLIGTMCTQYENIYQQDTTYIAIKSKNLHSKFLCELELCKKLSNKPWLAVNIRGINNNDFLENETLLGEFNTDISNEKDIVLPSFKSFTHMFHLNQLISEPTSSTTMI